MLSAKSYYNYKKPDKPAIPGPLKNHLVIVINTDSSTAGADEAALPAREWVEKLAPFLVADNKRAWRELAITGAVYIAVWVAACVAIQHSLLLALPLIVLGGIMMVRLFILQHDCGHGALFSSRKLNTWVGRCLGVVTLTPYEYWRRMHATHHAGSGNLKRRGVGDIDTLTVEEYKKLSSKERLLYRAYRNPFIMFIIGPAYLFLLRHRWPVGCTTQGTKPWFSVLTTNAGIALLFLVLIMIIGLKTFLLVHLPMVVIGGGIGIWMFYVQHQFDHTHWDEAEDWQHAHSALHGSSFYDLPKPFMWLTGNIGIHHVHHLSSRIAFHRLPAVLETYPELKKIGRLTFLESLKCVNLALWDTQQRKLVPFSAL